MADSDGVQVTSPYDGNRKEPPDDGIPLPLPERIGRYRVERILGKGGFGLVYLALDEQLRRPVAIKVPHASLLSSSEDVRLYATEARTVANLDHPNIAPVHDVGSTNDFPFFVVAKYIEGRDLATILKDSRLYHQQAAEVVATVAEALHHAHKQGLVHRDIKPGNIVIDKNGKPYVVDFGLALREQDVGKGSTHVGTPAYMSPEQARGEGHRVDGRSDIFSLGAVFYESLVGRRPFRGDSKAEVLDQIVAQEPRPLRQCDDTIPKELDRICLRMLSKKASERYSTAKDAAEDLRHFLKQEPGNTVSSLAANLLSHATPAEANRVTDTPAATPTDSQPIRIVPKGLRSFDEHDADFFLELLPGPRDRDGLPESIRFWKTRIEEADPDKTFSVGLVYGPSGCGKSSLVKAGLLPRLSQDVLQVYVEATPDETETRLLHGLRRQCPALETNLGLKDTFAALRRGQGVPVGKKLLFVIDQFEQWLHAKTEQDNTELVQALRQCDGGHLQCIVMVRDDFWMAATQFMRELEIRLIEGQNSAPVDRFLVRHAEKVLTAFGRAFGVLYDGAGEVSKDQREFLKKVITGLAEDGKVVSVRLALFAEMMKGKQWTPAILKKVGGTQGIGVTFLEETFSAPNAPPEHRYHQKAARALLNTLLPESGSDIKGNMRSYNELLEGSGYAARPKDFDGLIRVLDNELRLITPTDPEGAQAVDGTMHLAQPRRKYYQLTHDYLVPSLREWLTRKQKETQKGRAELRLAERSARWNAKPEHRQLPSLWEYLNIRLLTRRKNWTQAQQMMMGKAGQVHGIRSALAAVVLVGVFLAGRDISGRFQATSLVEQLTSADIAQVPGIVERLDAYRSWANPLLWQEDETAERGSNQKLNLALALLPVDAAKVADLREQLVLVTPSQFPVVRDALVSHKDDLIEPLWSLALDPDRPTRERFQAACALATYAPKDKRWIEIDTLVANQLVSRQASEFLAWREMLRPAKEQLIKALGVIYRDPAQERQYRAYATETLANYSADRSDELFDLLADAERFQFPVIFDPLMANKAKAIALGQAELSKLVPEQASKDEMDAFAKRQANAAVALLRMGDSHQVWPLLKHSPAPRVRSYFIHWLSPLGGDPQAIIGRLDAEPDLTIRRALLLTLGEFSETQLPQPQRLALIEDLLEVYERDPDAGLHGAAEWLLRRWGQGDQIQAVVQKLRSNEEQLQTRKGEDKKQWYINTQGQTFVIVDAGVLMNSIEAESGNVGDAIPYPLALERRFAIAVTEVTKEQFQRSETGAPKNPRDLSATKTEDSPQTYVTWYEAAAYCNWLSEQEGISTEEWCYEPNEEGNYGPGMKAKARFFELRGYRLPTEVEWEYACRAATVTSRYYGSTDTLLPKYAWYQANSDSRTWPVGSLKPNDLGLFDMLGNAAEWCHERHIGSLPVTVNAEEIIGQTSDERRVLRGGAFNFDPKEVSSAYRNNLLPVDHYRNFGFRPARTYP